MRKSAFCNCAADQRLCFPYTDCTIPLIHKSKCQAFSHLLWLYSSVCVGLGRKPRRPIFSQQGSNTGSIFFSSPEPKAHGELIVYRSIRRPSVRPCVRPSVNIFKLKYLRNQWANRNQILSEASLGWGIDCIRFWTR